VTVIGVGPLPGAGVEIDKIPGDVRTLSAADLAPGGSPNLTGALAQRLGGVSLNDDLDDPFQPDVLYRGFEASPVVGTPQGLAVYQNGARINEAFGDTVNWDLIADLAIARIDVVGANPVFGLNALGGAMVATMKTGFTDPGGQATLLGGAFGRREESAQYGADDGVLGFYLAARAADEDGWRRLSPDRVRQIYAAASLRTDKLTLDLGFTGADNALDGQGAAPVQELAIDRALVFTGPQSNLDRLAFVTLNGSYAATPTFSLQGSLYWRGFRQAVANGNATGYVACARVPDIGRLCQSDGLTPLAAVGNGAIPDISLGGAVPIGENDAEAVRSNGYGGSLQATSTAPVFGRGNHFTAGAAIDRATTGFASSLQVGVIDAALQVAVSGFTPATPEGTAFTATPVDLNAVSTYLGLYATDTFDVTPRLSVTASARYNVARIGLADRHGTDLDGGGAYRHLNPAIGATWKATAWLAAYAGYSVANRAPTPSEIECSNPLLPCLLPSSLASDPPTLKQVVSHTWEAGVRGGAAVGPDGGHLTWSAGLFRTDVDDDIYGVATSLSAGFFQNIGGTRRQGAELALVWRGPKLRAWASYSLIDATFQSSLTLSSPAHPFADANGDIEARPGDRLPGIPRRRLKVGLDYHLEPRWVVGASVAVVGSEFYRGDESNQLAPLPGYAVLSLRANFDLTRRAGLFAGLDNALNAKYATFGVLGDPTGVGAPGVPDGSAANPRFQSPAALLAAYGGLRVRF